jgi:hypothetical protein
MKMTRVLRVIFWLVILASLVVAVSGRAQNAPGPQPPAAQLTGVWRAEADGLPAVVLVVSDESGNLTGAIMFYFHVRDAVDKPYRSTPGLPEPIFNLKFDGESLTFQVSHRRAHPPRTLSDPPVTMRLKLTGTNASGQVQGELTNLSERSSSTMPPAIMVKSDY